MNCVRLSSPRMRPRMWSRRVALGFASTMSVLAVALSVLVPGVTPPAAAVTGAQFDPGLIISDSIYFDRQSLNVNDVQAFLNARVPTCSQSASLPCLKTYTESTSSRPADKYCAGFVGQAAEGAASIITRVAESCGINPKVLLVTLQKERALVTSTSPTSSDYKVAMGYGCPDTAACDTMYYGFFNQMYSAARQMKVYTLNPNSFGYRPGRVNTIQYHPNVNCGSSQVFIQNQATANLYIYTPYQPDAAALANLYGTGGSCSSYGNRNFWRTFNDWFGSPIVDRGVPFLISASYQDTLSRAAGPDEIQYWSQLVGRGFGRTEIATGFLTSTEHRTRELQSVYRAYLGREAGAGDISFWLAQYGRMVTGTDELIYYVSQSPEYFQRSGNDVATLIASAYTQLLGRTARPDEVSFWLEQYRVIGKEALVYLIWESDEAHSYRISEMYKTYLGREAGGGDRAFWTPIARRFSGYDVLHGILTSPEYWTRSISRFSIT